MEYSKKYMKRMLQVDSNGVLLPPPNSQLANPPTMPLRYVDFTEEDMLYACNELASIGFDAYVFNIEASPNGSL